MATSRAERRERTRARIIDAAEAAFADRGFSGARVEAIAKRVGINRASLFHHFPDKASLYEAVIEARVLPYFEDVQKLLARSDHATDNESPFGLVVQGVSLQAEFFARNPRIAKIFLREITDYDSARGSHLAALIGPLVDRVKHFLEDKRSRGLCDPVDPEHLVTAVAGSALLQVAARPILHPGASSATPDPAELERHKASLAHLVERLLGIDASLPQATTR